MIDFGTHGNWHYGGINLWLFVLALVLIGSFFSYMKTRSRNEVIREALKAGQTLDPKMLREFGQEDNGGLILSGLITMAVGVGLLFMGYQIGKTEGESEVFEILKGVAAIPGLIGLVLFGAGIFQAMTRRRD